MASPFKHKNINDQTLMTNPLKILVTNPLKHKHIKILEILMTDPLGHTNINEKPFET